MISPRLLAAYCRTDYVAEGASARIGRRSPAMDAVLLRLRTRQAVFITAWNPGSRRMPEGWNRRMQRRLVDRLQGVAWIPARGAARRWSEEQVLAAMPPRRAVGLARRLRQRAVVVVAVRRSARLVLLAFEGAAG